MRFGLITFNPHPNDLHLIDQFLILLKPQLSKPNATYVLGYESKGTPSAHVHLLLGLPDSSDITNLRSKFKSAPWKNFTKICKEGMTEITELLDKKGLEVKMVKKTEEDHMKTLGYVSKEHVHDSQKFTEIQITQAVKYYHQTERTPKQVDSSTSWKILNGKTAHVHIEHFAKEHDLSIDDPKLVEMMSSNFYSFNMISTKQKDKILAELILSHAEQGDIKKDTFAYNHAKEIVDDNEIHDFKWKQRLLDLMIKLNNGVVVEKGKFDNDILDIKNGYPWFQMYKE